MISYMSYNAKKFRNYTKHQMKTCAEHLPTEVWLLIFQYFEANNIFQSFHNLNTFFNQILASNYLLFYVRWRTTSTNYLETSLPRDWFDSVLTRTICLRPFVQSRLTYFLQFLLDNTAKLTQLQSLSISLTSQDTPSIPHIHQTLQNLSTIKYLSLTCMPNESLFASIFALPNLSACRLVLRESGTPIEHHHDVYSNIKQLYIVFLDNVNCSLIDHLLMYTPQLKRLEITGSSFSYDLVAIITRQLFVLPELRIFKLKLENGYLIEDCFKYLHTTMPVLKHLHLDYSKYLLSSAFLDRFISYWWPIIEEIARINVYIKGHLDMDISGNDLLIDLKKKREILLAKNNQSHGALKVIWAERCISKLKLIEISIVKR